MLKDMRNDGCTTCEDAVEIEDVINDMCFKLNIKIN